ncbi:MAG: PKD domain-containing protein [Cytophagales bacterium]|nr:MAG: PKD domain-containing protein [Cytophagales bacterium]TAF60178.1 MAG: PKD domain-containing protein [Cytophagales bacterium]
MQLLEFAQHPLGRFIKAPSSTMRTATIFRHVYFALFIFVLLSCRKEKDPELYIRNINTEFLSCRSPYEVLFTATVSEANANTRYLWNFGDSTTSTLANPTHKYKRKGIFNVTLKVFNPGEDSLVLALPLNTDVLPLSSRFEYSGGPEGILADFTRILFTNNSKYANNYLWDFGNGDVSREKDPTYTYTTAGTYTVKFFAICGVGGDTTVSAQTIKVQAPPKPRAGFVVQVAQDNYRVPAKVTFDNRSTYATVYIWDFGNGDLSTAFEPTYTYNRAGDYLVKLYAIHKRDTSISQQYVSIRPAPTRLFISRLETDLSTFQLPDTIDDSQTGYELYTRIYNDSREECESRVLNSVVRFPISFQFPSDIRFGNTEMAMPRDRIRVEVYDADTRNRDDLLEDFDLSTRQIVDAGYPRTIRVNSGSESVIFYLDYD